VSGESHAGSIPEKDVKQAARSRRKPAEKFMDTLIQDIRYSFRFLRNNPLYAIVIVLTLAVGIGANSGIFSIVNAVLLRPLPFKEPERLVLVFESFPKLGFNQVPASAPNYFDWKEQNHSFEDMAAAFNMPEYGFNLVLGGDAVRVPGGRASANLLSVLGLNPIVGRSFLPEEDRPGGAPVALISSRLWKDRLGSDPGVAGRKILIDSAPHTVVGVMPPEMQALGNVDVWVPTALNRNAPRGDHMVGVVGRLKTGVAIQSAQKELEIIERRLATEMGMSPDLVGINLTPVARFYTGPIAPALLLLQGAVALLLLVACANVAGLVLARAVNRTQEISIRMALGAGRGRMVRQLLTESTLLALAGGGVGLLIANWGIRLLRAALPDLIPRMKSMSIDNNVLIFTILVSLLTGILFGLVPAWKSGRQDLAAQLNSGTSRLVGSISGQRTRSLLLAAEIALTLVLAITAGLLVKSFWKLVTVPAGFQADHLLTLGLNLPEYRYKDPGSKRSFTQELLRRLDSIPGVRSASAISLLPMRGNFLMKRSNVAAFAVEGHPAARPGEEPNADYRFVTAGYFGTMGIPLLQGRYFNEADTPERPRIVLINETMARKYFQNENPLGRKVRFMPVTSEPYEIVGVVGDVHLGSLADPVDPAIYILYDQQPRLVMSVVMRTSTPPGSLAAAVRRAILNLDAELPVSDLQSMDSVVSMSLLPQRLAMTLMTLFALFALALGILGVYGLTAMLVNQRTREIGIRMALGAEPSRVLRLILARGTAISLVGTALGLPGAFVLTRGMGNLLYGVTAHDPWIFGGIALLMVGSALAAALVPALRAARISPCSALRYE
jgi:putative ABC transport system permease protein